MKDLSSNRKIINILECLKDSKQNYPPELMQTRRKIFAKQAASIAVVLDIGTAAYLYREKFSETLNNTISPHVEYITNTINSYSSPPVVTPDTEEPFEIPTSISPAFTTTESPIPTTTLISTPSPINIESNNGEEVDKIISTPKPKDKETKEPDDKPSKALKNK